MGIMQYIKSAYNRYTGWQQPRPPVALNAVIDPTRKICECCGREHTIWRKFADGSILCVGCCEDWGS